MDGREFRAEELKIQAKVYLESYRAGRKVTEVKEGPLELRRRKSKEKVSGREHVGGKRAHTTYRGREHCKHWSHCLKGLSVC